MPDAIITSTESTFGTISGTFAADQSTVTGTITGIITGTLDGSVGVPGQQGPAGPQGPQGEPGEGVPVGGTAGQFLTKIDGTNYNTDWTTLNLSAYLTDAPSDGSQYARQSGAWEVVSIPPDYITSVAVGTPLSVNSGELNIDLSAYAQQTWVLDQGFAPLASPAFYGNPTAPTPTFGDNDTSISTTAFVQAALAGGTAVAKNLEVYVRNQTGSTVPAGSIVYISGATGNRPLITLAQANNDANSAQTMGFTKTAIANNGFGYVIVRGELENIDTSGLTEGVQLYLSPTTAGTWTTTKPSAPQHLVYVGIVVRAHPTQGVILVAVQNGYELPELHDVKITSPTNGQVLKYDSAQSLWVNGMDVGGVAWGAITGTLSSQLDLQGALDLKANLSGATFTGKVNTTVTATTAALNIAPQDTPPTSTVAGDVWIGTNINYRSFDGVAKVVANTNTQNQFSSVQAIDVSSALNALRITQRGTGPAIVVEDSATPDSTAFVVDQFGKVGIGVAPDATAALKVDTNGIMFGDGTTQTTATVAGPTYVNIQVFGGPASSGSFTWNKPTGAKSVEVLMMSGGGGGGSGARQATTAGRFGGGGGGGAGGIYFKLDADALASSETVTVGAGGAGGAAVTTDTTNGNPGTKGGDSVFGPITCRGGNFGGGGTDTTGAAGATSLWYQWISNIQTVNNRGGVAPAAAPGIAYELFTCATGGGGGASRLANVTLPSGGGAGGNKLASAAGGVESGLTSAIVGGAGGLGGTSTPPVAGTNGTEYLGGTGGGGGYYRPTSVGNPGAAGGWPGGGGGGGGCSDNTFNSGAGAAGGNGVVLIITYCS
jgi:hypothetical protein